MTDRPVRVVLSVNFNHDGAAVLLVDGRPAGFVCTERFSRLKKHPGLREDDLDEILDQAGIEFADVDHVMLCNLHLMDSPDIPELHGSDLKSTWFEFWVNQCLDLVTIRGRTIPCTVNPDHHLIHSSAAYYTSPFEDAVCLAVDTTGCRAQIGRERRLWPLGRGYDWFNANIGYAHVAEMLFGSSIVGAGKVMGLAPYARHVAPPTAEITTFAQLVARSRVDPVYVETGGRRLNATLARYIQIGLEQQMIRALADAAGLAARRGIPPLLCLSGGNALNAVANQLAFETSTFSALHMHPACGDDGTAIGAALWFWHHVLDHPRESYTNDELMYSRRVYGDDEVDRAVHGRAGALEVRRVGDTPREAARLIAEGAVVGWFEGASEIGPRALGHRSLLADPRAPGMADHLNTRVKFREHFRPYAPAVINEKATEWFGLRDSPFMLRASPVLRPGVPAITAVDGTSRIQTVARGDSPSLYHLLEAFDGMTGIPLVLNTSFNVKGEPIVETPDEAVDALLRSEMDAVAFPGLVVRKRRAEEDVDAP